MEIVEIMMASPVAATIFVITLITSIKAFKDPILRDKFLFIPYRVYHHKEYARLFTSGLIHGGNMHLVFNMISYFYFAFTFERVIGHWQFMVFYLATLALSDITILFKHKDNPAYSALGASGAVSAVVLGMILCAPGMSLMLFFIPIPIPGWLFGIAYIMYSHYASKNQTDNIGHEAHLWGAISGIILTIIFLAANGRLDLVISQWQSYIGL